LIEIINFDFSTIGFMFQSYSKSTLYAFVEQFSLQATCPSSHPNKSIRALKIN